MRASVVIVMLLVLLAGCAGLEGHKYVVRFQPYDLALDAQAQGAVQSAAAFAKAHPLSPITIAGYASPADTGDFQTLRQQRVGLVQSALVAQGVDPLRIEILGNGILYPDGVPDEVAGQIDIAVGL